MCTWYASKNERIGVTIASLCTIAAAGVMIYYQIQQEKASEMYRNNLISKLVSKVEAVDGKAGISFWDQVDYATRAGIPTTQIVEGKPLDLSSTPTSKLERVLKSYEQ